MGVGSDSATSIAERNPNPDFIKLCEEFRLTEEETQESWSNYENVRQQCSLEGGQIRWYACAIYLTTRPNTSDPSDDTITTQVSLAKLVEVSGLSVLEFFEKLSKWGEMSSNSRRLHEHISRVQANFAVSAVIFKKFLPIFRRVFNYESTTGSESTSTATAAGTGSAVVGGKKGGVGSGNKGAAKKNKGGIAAAGSPPSTSVPSTSTSTSTPSTATAVAPDSSGPASTVVVSDKGNPIDPMAPSLLQFIWTLFVSAKKHFTGISDDLMNCFQLLLCCIDYVRRDLMDSYNSDALQAPFAGYEGDESCTIEMLCNAFDASVLDAKHFQVHWWAPKLKNMIVDGLLPTAAEEGGILTHMETYNKALDENYERVMLKRGEMDERIFLPTDPTLLLTQEGIDNPLIGLQSRETSEGSDSELLLRMSVQSCLEKISQFRLPTPLSGRSYVISGEQFCPATPVSARTAAAAKLASLLSDSPSESSPTVLRIFTDLEPNPGPLIDHVLKEAGDAFIAACSTDGESHNEGFDSGFSEFSRTRREQAECLYYRLLERVVEAEKDRSQNLNTTFTSALSQEIFHKSLLACAYELVIFSYNSQRVFPWVIDRLGIPAVHFYKVIELVIRAEPELSRDMVKHLNMAEEMVLEELAWSAKSPLWALIQRSVGGIPSCQQVAHPSQLDPGGVPRILSGGRGYQSPAVKSIGAMSGAVVAGNSAAKRKLTFEGSHGTTTEVIVTAQESPSKLMAVERVLSSPPGGSGGPGGAIIVPAIPGSSESVNPSVASTSDEPRSSTLSLFFRKVYYLASVRLLDLGDRLRLSEKSKQGVWTMLEQTIQNHTELLKGRHLDQLLMSSIYVVGKVSKLEMSFHDIMLHYRYQPQASSRVYRHVLLSNSPDNENQNISEGGEGEQEGEGEQMMEGVTTEGDGGDKTQTQPNQAPTTTTTAASQRTLRSASTLPVPGVSSNPGTPEPATAVPGVGGGGQTGDGVSGEGKHIGGTDGPETAYGDLIRFYNQVFINHIEEFAKKLIPGMGSGGDSKEVNNDHNRNNHISSHFGSSLIHRQHSSSTKPCSSTAQNSGAGKQQQGFESVKREYQDARELNEADECFSEEKPSKSPPSPCWLYQMEMCNFFNWEHRESEHEGAGAAVKDGKEDHKSQIYQAEKRECFDDISNQNLSPYIKESDDGRQQEGFKRKFYHPAEAKRPIAVDKKKDIVEALQWFLNESYQKNSDHNPFRFKAVIDSNKSTTTISPHNLPSIIIQNLSVPLSPLPSVKSHALSPRRRVAEGVYVSPMTLPGNPSSPSRPLRYSFSRSPYKDLKAINTMIKQGLEQGKPIYGARVFGRTAAKWTSKDL